MHFLARLVVDVQGGDGKGCLIGLSINRVGIYLLDARKTVRGSLPSLMGQHSSVIAHRLLADHTNHEEVSPAFFFTTHAGPWRRAGLVS